MTTTATTLNVATGTTSKAVPPGKLAHMVFRTSRYAEMLEFYKTLFGSREVFANGGLAFLTYDDEHHRFAFLNVPGLAPQAPGVAGVHHVAFTYNSLANLIDNYEHAKGKGIEPVWCTNHGPTTSFYYRDPDGNQLELQVENYETVEASTEFFFSPDFAENPIGVDFDPAELARRFRAGESVASLLRRPSIGPRGFDHTVKLF
jgi:catechol 2,3-dioxygenase-like lactoylglutathione lyase family enzyme